MKALRSALAGLLALLAAALAGLARQVPRAVAALRGDPLALGIEVTESILISNMDRAIEVLQQVRALGLPVAIDDFGTGYSSLAYIVTLPIDELKIDRAFVKKITADKAYEGIVRTCVSLARGLNLKVVAEGVERPEQHEWLLAAGCDFSQGFLYSHPLELDAFEEMVLESRLRRLGRAEGPAAASVDMHR